MVERIGSARLVLVGEALDYSGGHFSGIPMTSERMLLAGQHVFSSIAALRTSKPEKSPRGFSEPTASMVWNALLEVGLSSERFVLWNAFPWHPFDAPKSWGRLLQMLQLETVIAIGVLAAVQLERIGRVATRVRHPAGQSR